MGGKASKPEEGAATGATTTASSGGKAKAYLVFTPESGGTLTLHWSTSAVSGAILTGTPSKPVPAHKLTTNAGRIELGRNFGVTKTKLLEAFASFIRELSAVDGSIKVVENDKCEFWTLAGTKVKAVGKGSFDTKGLDAVACMPANNTSYKGVQTIEQSQFVGTATREGAFWKR